MPQFNYHHLLYFRSIAKEGSVLGAARANHVAPSAISAQLKLLEEQVGDQLFYRAHRKLQLTPLGKMVLTFADNIFALGQELERAVATRTMGASVVLNVGVANAIPKVLVKTFLEPLLTSGTSRVVCRESSLEELMADLSLHNFDVVLSDTSSAAANLSVEAYAHGLGSAPVAFFSVKPIAERLRLGFPGSLNGEPMLLPTRDSAVRPRIDAWLRDNNIQPRLIAEIEDRALLKALGQSGAGVFPTAVFHEAELETSFQCFRIGSLGGVSEEYFAITLERNIRNPALEVVLAAVRTQLAP